MQPFTSLARFAGLAVVFASVPAGATPPLAVRGTPRTSAAAVSAASARLERMLATAPRIAENMRADGDEVHVFGTDEAVTDLPELRHRRGLRAGTQRWEQRYRGGEALGRFAECGAHNLLALPRDPYPAGYDVCSHEIAHVVFDVGLDARLRARVVARYHAALRAGLWRGMYAAKSVDEFFAETSMRYFDLSHDTRPRAPSLHLGAAALRAYDPETFSLLDDIYRGRLVPARTSRRVLAPLGRVAARAARSHAGVVPSTLWLENASSATLRWARVDAGGGILVAPHATPAGTIDTPGGAIGDVITVIDEASRARVATVVLADVPGSLRITDRMVRAAAKDTDGVPRVHVPLPF